MSGGAVDRRRRVIIEGVKPEVDCGRFPIKRTVGEPVVVEADIYADGHDAVSCILLDRADSDSGRGAKRR
jgi:starch synthase (maltosyl-transferring)